MYRKNFLFAAGICFLCLLFFCFVSLKENSESLKWQYKIFFHNIEWLEYCENEYNKISSYIGFEYEHLKNLTEGKDALISAANPPKRDIINEIEILRSDENKIIYKQKQYLEDYPDYYYKDLQTASNFRENYPQYDGQIGDRLDWDIDGANYQYQQRWKENIDLINQYNHYSSIYYQRAKSSLIEIKKLKEILIIYKIIIFIIIIFIMIIIKIIIKEGF
jgi:hypothetical protein